MATTTNTNPYYNMTDYTETDYTERVSKLQIEELADPMEEAIRKAVQLINAA